MNKTSKREQNRNRQRRQKWIRYATGGGLAVLVLGVLGFLLWQSVKPAVGEAISIPANYSTHVEIDQPLSYPSDPPAGGQHYASSLDSGFYEDATLPGRPGEAAGYLVHNLEHGYVIFWYNCALLDEVSCIDLKNNIKNVMNARNNLKVIAYPWDSLDVPLVMTSWGRLQRFEQFDERLARTFVERNLNRAPESGAQ